MILTYYVRFSSPLALIVCNLLDGDKSSALHSLELSGCMYKDNTRKVSDRKYHIHTTRPVTLLIG